MEIGLGHRVIKGGKSGLAVEPVGNGWPVFGKISLNADEIAT